MISDENKYYLLAAMIFVVVLAVAGAFIAMIYGNRPVFSESVEIAPTRIEPTVQLGMLIFSPPSPAEAPPSLRDEIVLGYNIMMKTHEFAPSFVGGKLNCRNCHFEGGRIKGTVSLVGVAAKYPRPAEDTSAAEDLGSKIQACFERNLGGKAPPLSGKEAKALLAYFQWISSGIPIGADPPWLGLRPMTIEAEPNGQAGLETFTSVCTNCHGPEGLGTGIAPPLWGPDSFTDGSSMGKVEYLSSFIYHFMPRGNPSLKKPEAVNVAAFILSRQRPHFEAAKPGGRAQL